MAGIYFHIPFCKQACHYCDFHFSTVTKNIHRFPAAMKNELALRKHELKGRPVETIYFGGGTPSLFTAEEIKALIDAVKKSFRVSSDPEVTLETNPDDISREKLKLWKQAGVNRLSIGVQSFFDGHLEFFNRSHNAEQSRKALQLVKEAGYQNITADLIYGFPQLTDGQLKENIETLLHFGVPHISAYALTIEPKTVLSNRIARGKAEAPDEEQAFHHFSLLRKELVQRGFDHYEISNFGKPGFYSRHNSNYWKGAWYLGIGPSAHSHYSNKRAWNVRNNARYLLAIEQDKPEIEEEQLTETDRYNEWVMTGLRTKWGLDTAALKANFSAEVQDYFQHEAEQLVSTGKLRMVDGTYRLADEALFFADGIASQLFLVRD